MNFQTVDTFVINQKFKMFQRHLEQYKLQKTLSKTPKIMVVSAEKRCSVRLYLHILFTLFVFACA
jgi:hypothetical protein